MIDSPACAFPKLRFCSRSFTRWSAACWSAALLVGLLNTPAAFAMVDATDVCTHLLRAIDRVAPRANDEHPVPMFYRAIDTGFWSASAGGFGPELANYVAPEDLAADEALRPDYVAPDARLRLRREMALEYRALFAATAVDGVDLDLAHLNLAMLEVNKDVQGALHAGQRGAHWEFVDAAAVKTYLEAEAAWRLDKHLTNARLAWLALTPGHQHAFVEWLGRVIYDYVPMFERSKVDQDLYRTTGEIRTETTRYIPEFKLTKDDFVRADGGDPQRAAARFYRHVGGQWMRLYGIIFLEDPRLPEPVRPAAPPTRTGWLARLFGR